MFDGPLFYEYSYLKKSVSNQRLSKQKKVFRFMLSLFIRPYIKPVKYYFNFIVKLILLIKKCQFRSTTA